MRDWYTMQVTEEKIAGAENHFRFTVGIDTIEMIVSYPTGDYFEDVNIEILNHYIRNNKSRNPSRTIALTERIYAHLRIKYLEELKSVFADIACQPATERLLKRFSCMGHTFFQGSTPEEVFTWFFKHYCSTCAAGYLYDLLVQVPTTDGFFSEIVAWYLGS